MDISVVIPVLNEADRIVETVRRVRRADEQCQIIVVDGGSSDGTLARAAEADVCLTAPEGRAIQQNVGAEAAQGEVLLFLHADCWLEEGALDALRRELADRRVVGGCFRQRIEASGLQYRLLEWGNTQRVRAWQWAYGDQGIFVRRDIFQQVGGFPDVRLMEDLLLMKRLKRLGRIAVLDSRIYVSARRWQKRGVVRQTLCNWSMTALVQCGVSPDRLVGFYPHVR